MKILKKDFIKQVKEYVRTYSKLLTIKLVRENYSKKVYKKYGLKDAKNVVDKYFMYPLVLWLFISRGFKLNEPHMLVFIISNSYSSWTEKVERVTTVREMKKECEEVIKEYNKILYSSEKKREYKGLAFEYWDFDGKRQLLRL